MFKYFTLDNFEFKDKVVGIRVDINSPIIDKKVVLNERIVKCVKTIKELSKKGAKIVLLAHQGRLGKSDCVSLKEHAKLLEKEIKRKVDFIDEIYSKKVEKKINDLKPSEILLLENLRFTDDENTPQKKSNQILELEKLFDYYVFDAFSVSHRSQTSVIGFTHIPNIAGRLLQEEIHGLSEIEEARSPKIFLFGGAKPDDLIVLIEKALKEDMVDQILLTGVIGEVALHTKGYKLGKKLDFLKEHEYLNTAPKIKELLRKHPHKFELPQDVAIIKDKKRIEIKVEDLEKNSETLKDFSIQDIGSRTANIYSKILKGAGSIYFKGPAGNFEEKGFQEGTKILLKGITQSKAFTYMGGGHSVTAAKMFKYLDKFSYISLAGGALVKFLSSEELPGLTALEKSFEKFENMFEDFIVVGSNTIDIGLSVPHEFENITLGDKIKIQDNFKTTVGGGGINVSICLSRLGASVAYLGKLSFENIDLIKETLTKNKISLIDSKLSQRPIAKSILLDTKDDDRVIFTYRGQNAYLERSDFDESTFRSANYYFTSLTGQSFSTLLNLAKSIKSKDEDSMICYNPSLYLIKKEKRIKNLLKYTDILILNYEEAQELVGEGSISECLKKLSKNVSKLVIITDSSKGAYLYDKRREYFQEAIPPKKIIDSTGAGDSFAGTFFYFYSKAYGIRKSLNLAAKNASNVVSSKGAQEGLSYFEDLIKNK